MIRLRRWARDPQARFTDEVAGVVRSVLGARVRPAPDFALEVTLAGGETGTMNLHNLYAEVQGVDDPEREHRIRSAVMALTPQPRPTTWEEAGPRLLPAVRAVSLGASMECSGPVRRSLVPFVDALCVIDSQHAMTFATGDDLRGWGVDEATVMARAVENLCGRPLEAGVAETSAIILTPDGYASSWLAAPRMLAAVAARLGGEVVAIAADRDHLVLIDTADVETLVTVLGTTLDQYRSAPRRLSPVPYLVGPEGISVWTPPEGHPAAVQASGAQRFLAATEYSRQQATLQDLFEKTETDVYVSSCTLMKQGDGSLYTYSLWAEGVTDGLVPQADVLVLRGADRSEGTTAVRWDDALRIAGRYLERTSYDPPLWRHTAWPDAATLAELHRTALPSGD